MVGASRARRGGVERRGSGRRERERERAAEGKPQRELEGKGETSTTPSLCPFGPSESGAALRRAEMAPTHGARASARSSAHSACARGRASVRPRGQRLVGSGGKRKEEMKGKKNLGGGRIEGWSGGVGKKKKNKGWWAGGRASGVGGERRKKKEGGRGSGDKNKTKQNSTQRGGSGGVGKKKKKKKKKQVQWAVGWRQSEGVRGKKKKEKKGGEGAKTKTKTKQCPHRSRARSRTRLASVRRVVGVTPRSRSYETAELGRVRWRARGHPKLSRPQDVFT